MWTGAHDHLHVGGTRAAGGNTAQRHGRHEGRRHARARDQKQRPETHRNRGLFHGRVHGGVRPRVEVGTESSLQGGSDGGFRSWRAKQTPSNPQLKAFGVYLLERRTERRADAENPESQHCWEPHAGRSESAHKGLVKATARPDARRLRIPPPAKLPKVR